jgi:hypothetical protein
VVGGRWLSVGRGRAAGLSYEQRGGEGRVASGCGKLAADGIELRTEKKGGRCSAVGREASRGGAGSVRRWDGGGRWDRAVGSGGESCDRQDASKMQGKTMVGGGALG